MQASANDTLKLSSFPRRVQTSAFPGRADAGRVSTWRVLRAPLVLALWLMTSTAFAAEQPPEIIPPEDYDEDQIEIIEGDQMPVRFYPMVKTLDLRTRESL